MVKLVIGGMLSTGPTRQFFWLLDIHLHHHHHLHLYKIIHFAISGYKSVVLFYSYIYEYCFWPEDTQSNSQVIKR